MSQPDAPALDVALPRRYRVRRILGIGGMATVYLADDAETGREVAVKVLKSDLAGAVAAARFLREIRLTGHLTHPNIVPLLDSGELNGVPYYVMPCVHGESLRRRLERERQLPLADVIRITRALAAALEAAHADGVVHRDVKPENVLLGSDRVLLADFGIARAFTEAAGEKFTDSGVAIGTPGYMSPEQASGEGAVDWRSDVYSLACVAFEMLAGEPPWTGPTAQAVVAKQLSLPVPSLAVVRDTLSDAVDDVMRRAMARVPADRFQGAGAFVDALEAASRAPATIVQRMVRRVRRNRGRMMVGAAAVLLVLTAGWLAADRFLPGVAALTAADSARYAVLPFAPNGAQASVAASTARVVRDRLLAWGGISVVDEGRVRDAVGSQAGATLSGGEAAALARRLRAGRYVRGELTAEGGHSELRLQLVDGVGRDTVLAELAAPIATGAAATDSVVRLLTDSLVLHGVYGGISATHGSASLAARQAFGRGMRAIDEWQLPAADSAFDEAARFDARFARAQLWLALVRLWSGVEPARWRIAAEQAGIAAASFGERERLLAEAAMAHARGELEKACPLWRSLTVRDSLDATAWYGSAHCLTVDNVVLPDKASPSGWKFRTSRHRAVQDYQRAFRLRPSVLASFGGRAFETLRSLFYIRATELRRGRSLTTPSQTFSSSMEWDHDSIAFVPYLKRPDVSHTGRRVDAIEEAVRHQRELVRDVASTWVASYPESPTARQALAMALASLGESSALDTLARARALARDPSDRDAMAGVDLSMQLAFALRDGDGRRLAAMRRSADSVLTNTPASLPSDPVLMTALAALTGRANTALRFSRAPEVAARYLIPTALRETAAPLLLLSALGGPADTLSFLEQRMAEAIERTVPAQEKLGRRMEFLVRAASMAFPAHRSLELQSSAAADDPLVLLQIRMVQGKHDLVRHGLDSIAAIRRTLSPELVTLDALMPEAALCWMLGEAQLTADWLDPTLRVLPQIQPGVLANPLHAASLVPAMLLRARVAAQLGDHSTARRWASAVAALWSDADPFLQPFVREAQALSR